MVPYIIKLLILSFLDIKIKIYNRTINLKSEIYLIKFFLIFFNNKIKMD